MLTIGELSKATGANISTIRHYERVGLLSIPERSDGNQRRYSDTDRSRLMFITQARDLGLTVDAIRDMIDLAVSPRISEADANRIIDEQLSTVRMKLARLRKLENELERMTREEGTREEAGFRVIEALAEGS